MIMVGKFSNFPDELSKNDELREFELSGSDCMGGHGLTGWSILNTVMAVLFLLKHK